jgi:hypothetical protein
MNYSLEKHNGKNWFHSYFSKSELTGKKQSWRLSAKQAKRSEGLVLIIVQYFPLITNLPYNSLHSIFLRWYLHGIFLRQVGDLEPGLPHRWLRRGI